MRRTSEKAPSEERRLIMALYDLVVAPLRELRENGLDLLITHRYEYDVRYYIMVIQSSEFLLLLPHSSLISFSFSFFVGKEKFH